MDRTTFAATLFGVAATLSFLLSVFLWFFVDKQQGMFVGLWVPSVLALGAMTLALRRSQA